MKFFTSILLTALLSFAACLYLPWWSIAVVAFVVAALIPQKPMKAFLAAFTALFILWFALCFYMSNANDNILAHKVSVLIIKMDNPYLLMTVTALIGSLVASLAALSGSYLRKTK
jgi:hypothetical protein